MNILCYGDSNTYGYDPRGFLSDRYSETHRWTTLLAQTGHSVLNCGMNGREIPHRPAELRAAVQLFAKEPPDLLIIMLGSNDLLMNPANTAGSVADRMDTFLSSILAHSPKQQILLLSPAPMKPGVWVQEERLLRESSQLSVAYAALAQKHNTAFADVADWNIPLTFDGVHFSEDGHRAFFTALSERLATLIRT